VRAHILDRRSDICIIDRQPARINPALDGVRGAGTGIEFGDDGAL
jgi:hypothetical protein